MVMNKSKLLRKKLISDLVERNIIKSDAVETAFLSIKRECFLTKVGETLPLEDVYKNTSYGLNKDKDGFYLSASSSPERLAPILENIGLKENDNVLDIGTGSGYTAALISQIVGLKGNVTSIDIDGDLVKAANDGFQEHGLSNVEAICADGSAAYEEKMPYDVIIITCQQYNIYDSWLTQLKQGGNIAIPLTIDTYTHGSPIIIFKRVDNKLKGIKTIPGSFTIARGNLWHPPINQDHIIPIYTENKTEIGVIRIKTDIGLQSLPSPGYFNAPTFIPHEKSLSNSEFSGFFLYLTLKYDNRVLLYSKDNALGFRGIGISVSLSHDKSNQCCFFTRSGFICYNSASLENDQLLEVYNEWLKKGRLKVENFRFDAFLACSQVNLTGYDFIKNREFFNIGINHTTNCT